MEIRLKKRKLKPERSSGRPPAIWTIKSSASESDCHLQFLCLPRNEYYGIRIIKSRYHKCKDNKDSVITQEKIILPRKGAFRNHLLYDSIFQMEKFCHTKGDISPKSHSPRAVCVLHIVPCAEGKRKVREGKFPNSKELLIWLKKTNSSTYVNCKQK